MSFERTLAGYRRVTVLVGDTLQRIALRELGDAARWYDLVNLNGLRHPYLAAGPADGAPGILAPGQTIKVPSDAPDPSGVTGSDGVFGTDAELRAGVLVATAGGDFATITDSANLKQAILHRIAVRPGELLYHPAYGCQIHDLLGRGGDAVANQLGALFVDRALRADPRIARTERTVASIGGDVLRVEATAVAVDGKRIAIGDE